MACPITSADVAAELSPADPSALLTDPRLDPSTETACALVLADLGLDDYPDPCPAPIARAVVGVAVDVFRSPSAAFGYIIDDAGIASAGRDVLRRWRPLLDPYRAFLIDDTTGATSGGWGLA